MIETPGAKIREKLGKSNRHRRGEGSEAKGEEVIGPRQSNRDLATIGNAVARFQLAEIISTITNFNLSKRHTTLRNFIRKTLCTARKAESETIKILGDLWYQHEL